MHQLSPRFGAIYSPAEVMPVFGLTVADALPDVPIQTVSTGTPQLMIPLRNMKGLRSVQVDVSRYAELRNAGDFFSPHLFCLAGATPDGQTFARHFGLPPDTSEDPFTGSATGGMAAYCWRYGLLDEPQFVAQQGHWMGRPGQAEVTITGPRTSIHGVSVSGTGVVVIRGTLTLASADETEISP
jgi:trans-2,3-dihydro-3-hydroxyanthranilate isomerase